VELKSRIRNCIAQQKIRKDILVNTASNQHQGSTNTIDFQEPKEENLESYDEKWLKDLKSHVKKNLHKVDFKIPDLASEMNFSERTLFNKIKVYTGMTPSEYLRKARLALAMHYIKNQKYETIKEIANNTGFVNPRYFTIVFTKEFGKTPTEYIVKYRT